MKTRLKGVAKVNKRLASGRREVYFYAWRGGPRLSGAPGSPEFVKAYQKAHEARRKAGEAAGAPTLGDLIERFKASPEFFLRKAPSTQRVYSRYLALIEAKFGTLPQAALSAARMRGLFKDWRDNLHAANGARTADYAWSVLARLMSFAKDRGLIASNPCERGGRLYVAARQECLWSEQSLLRLYAAASPEVAAVVLFALWTGQRQGDCLAAKWTAIEGGRIKVRQDKGGRGVVIPIGQPLAERIATLPQTAEGTILTNSKGRAWTSSGFRASLRKAMTRAGITDDLHFHDLRGTAVTRMALAGCTTPQIAAVTGHSPRTSMTSYASTTLAVRSSLRNKLSAGWKTRANPVTNCKPSCKLRGRHCPQKSPASSKALISLRFRWWAHKGSNLGPAD